MKAVNLVPRESRRGTGTLSGIGIGTTAIFAALALGLALSVAYVILANGVTSRKDQLAKLNQQSNATSQEVARLKPYADLESLRESLLDRVRSLADGRYDWPTTLSRIARALPSDTSLTNFNGAGSSSSSSSAAPAAGAGTGTATPGSGPTVSLSGCTPSHQAVAGVIDRLRSVEGVASVSLQSSTLSATGSGGGATSGSTGCSGAEQFKLTVQMAAPAVTATPTAGATGATTATPSTTSTTPSTPSPAPASSPTASTGAAPGGTS